MEEYDAYKFVELCKTVFSSEKGVELLRILEKMYCEVPLFSENNSSLVYNVAKNDIVTYFKYCVKMSDKDHKKLLKVENNKHLEDDDIFDNL